MWEQNPDIYGYTDEPGDEPGTERHIPFDLIHMLVNGSKITVRRNKLLYV